MYLQNNTLLQGGKYKIVRFISSGGFGCTYEAVHTLMNTRVAIKEFFVQDFCNRDAETGEVSLATQSKAGLLDKLKKKFLEEATAVFQMHHMNIVRVTDTFDENGTSYYVMDYIDGFSLHDIVNQQGVLPENITIKYILQVADALSYVHSLNRLHLDVKPGNIMIDKHDNAILIDFGVSKHYDDESGENTSTLMGVNTKGYAAVELMNSSFTNFSPATDIYALAATFYKILTGVTPPNSLSLLSEEEVLQPLPQNISQTVRNAISAGMQLRRKDRPQSIAAFIDILNGEGGEDEKTVLDVKTSKINSPSHKVQQEDIKGNSINGHEYVDLGLSVKWATCNVGANSPSDYGDYYAWGETKTKSEYTEKNSLCLGKEIDSIEGNPQYDVARANWGSTWRLPTKEEIGELVSKCKGEWTTQRGHKGYKVTGPNGNSIFLPAAGWRYGTSLYHTGENGLYWSATPNKDFRKYSCHLSFIANNIAFRYWDNRFDGKSVRPVSE